MAQLFSNLPPFVLPVLIGLLIAGLISLWLYRNVSTRAQCPKCGDFHIDRVPRRGFWRNFDNVRAYRCANCEHRFLRLS